jgi:hypothetical protein
MYRLLTTALAAAFAGALLCVFAGDKEEIPENVRNHIEHLRKEADQAEKAGLFVEAAEMRLKAKKLLEEETRKIRLAREMIPKKRIEDEIDMLLLNRCNKERVVGEFLTYLDGLNLVNGLNLSREQMQLILKCLRKKMELSRDREWREVLKGYLLVKDGLEKDGRLSQQSRDLFFYTEPRHMKLMETEGISQKELDKLTATVEAALTDAQKEVMRTFVPCHIPPDEQNDPVRVGQAKTSSHQVRMLTNAREIPAGEFDGWFRNAIAPHVKSKVKNWNKCPECDKKLDEKDEIKRIRGIFEKVRRMKDVDFELEKEKLAKELGLEPDPPQKELDAKGVTRRIRQFLLDERFIGLMEHRIKQSGKSGSLRK